jgi:hypothetical protein
MALSLIYPFHKSVGHAPFSSLCSSVLFCPCTLNYSSFGIRFSYNPFDGLHGKHCLYCLRSLFTAPFLNNGLYIVVTHLRGRSYPGRCLSMGSLFLRERVLQE